MLDQETKLKISVDAAGAAKALNQVRDGADGVRQSLKDITAGAITTAKALAVVGAAGALAFGIKAIRDTANLADEMGKAAQKVGTTTKALSGLKYAADLAGVSFEQLQAGLAKVAKTAEDARDGSKSAQGAFGKLGIDAANYKDSAVLLGAIADAFARMENGARKTAIAQELFGKSGAQMIPLLNSGSAGIHAMAEEAERLGIVFDDFTARQAEQFNDDMTRLGAAADGLKVSLAARLFPALTEIAKATADAAREGGVLNGIWVGLGATMAHILGLDEVSKLKKQLDDVNKKIEISSKQLASGSMNPKGASDRIFNFLVPDVKLNDEAKQRLQQALENLEQERDRLIAAMSPAAQADESRVNIMVQQSELSAEVKEKEAARITAALEAQKRSLAAAENAFDNAKKKHVADLKEFQDLQKQLSMPATGANAKPTLSYEIEKAVDDARKAQELAAKAPATQADQLAQGALDKARAAGQLLKDYKAQQEATGSTIDAEAAQQLVERLGGDLLEIADKSSALQQQVAQDNLAVQQQLVQDTLAQAEALKHLVIGFDADGATQGMQSLMDSLRKQAEASPIILPVKVLPPGATGVTDSEGRMLYRDPLGYAEGGYIRGHGTGTSDSILARLSNGEYVITSAAVRKYGLQHLDALNSMRLQKFANGGAVGHVRMPTLSPAVAAGKSSLHRGTFNFPGIGRFELQGSSDLFDRLTRESLRLRRR